MSKKDDFNYSLANKHLNCTKIPVKIDSCPVEVIALHQEIIYDNAHYTPARHMHTFFEVHIMRKGEQVYQIGDEFLNCKTGDVLCIAPYVYHSIPGRTTEVEKYSLNFTYTHNDDKKTSYLDALVQKKYFVSHESEEITEIFELVLQEAHDAKSGWPDIVRILVEVMLKKLVRMIRPDQDVGETVFEESEHRIRRIERYIRDNIGTPISVDNIADYMHLSTKQLNRELRKGRATTLKTLIDKMKYEKAKSLLRGTSDSISKIGRDLGFENESSFNRFFSKMAGMTPGEYRKGDAVDRCVAVEQEDDY